MMATYLEEQTAVANILGLESAPDSILGNFINYVRQNEIANAYPFSWLRRGTSVVLDGNGEAAMPSDYNPTHKLYDLRESGSATGDDSVYYHTNQDVFDSVSPGNRVYYIDWDSSALWYRLKTNQVSKTLSLIYYLVPNTLSDNSDPDIIPDADVVEYLAASRYWLASERDETNHDRLRNIGMQRLAALIERDKKTNPQRNKRGSIYTANLGFNTGG